MTVQNGATVTSRTGYVGYNSTSRGVVTVIGAGAQWLMSDNLAVGVTGTGFLIIGEGGVVRNSLGFVGYNAAAVARSPSPARLGLDPQQ